MVLWAPLCWFNSVKVTFWSTRKAIKSEPWEKNVGQINLAHWGESLSGDFTNSWWEKRAISIYSGWERGWMEAQQWLAGENWHRNKPEWWWGDQRRKNVFNRNKPQNVFRINSLELTHRDEFVLTKMKDFRWLEHFFAIKPHCRCETAQRTLSNNWSRNEGKCFEEDF